MGLLSRNASAASDKKMIREITVLNRLGWVEKDGEQVNGKSIMGLMMLAAGQGSKLRVTCEGSDAEVALVEIETLVLSRFNEE